MQFNLVFLVEPLRTPPSTDYQNKANYINTGRVFHVIGHQENCSYEHDF